MNKVFANCYEKLCPIYRIALCYGEKFYTKQVVILVNKYWSHYFDSELVLSIQKKLYYVQKLYFPKASGSKRIQLQKNLILLTK